MVTPAILAPALRPGATIAVVSTSWQGLAALPARADRAVSALQRLGYQVRLMPHARDDGDGFRDWVAGTAQSRAADLHQAFADPEVGLVLSAIGGNHSAHLLEHLDLDLVAANPKPLCGYSDTTTLLHAIHARTGLVTFYGPALLPEFGEIGGPDAEVVEHFLAMLTQPVAAGPVPAVHWQSDEDRRESDAAGRARTRHEGEPRVSLRAGAAEGPLLAGCLPCLRNLAGTEYEPSYDGRILLVEPPEAPYDVQCADADLTWLRNSGRITHIAGLAVGRTDGWTSGQRDQLHRCVLEAVRDRDIPVLAGVECTHSAPLLTFPIGVPATLSGRELRLDGPAVA
ncbi:MAG: S66 peptidase family protein [Nocardioidaceae bacterium]